MTQHHNEVLPLDSSSFIVDTPTTMKNITPSASYTKDTKALRSDEKCLNYALTISRFWVFGVARGITERVWTIIVSFMRYSIPGLEEIGPRPSPKKITISRCNIDMWALIAVVMRVVMRVYFENCWDTFNKRPRMTSMSTLQSFKVIHRIQRIWMFINILENSRLLRSTPQITRKKPHSSNKQVTNLSQKTNQRNQ